jgi:coenzyme F420-reducing hydrogenase delta subunit
LQLVPRSDDLPYALEVAVDTSKCVSCGICTGSCPSSTPFRSTDELLTGIDLPDLSFAEMRERVHAIAPTLTQTPRILIIGCWHGAAGARQEGVLQLPCVAMAPPSLIDYVLTRGIADGVVIAGCSESACYNRLGIEWTRQRVAGERDPYLRARVPRERIAMIWASPMQQARFDGELAAFKARLAALPRTTAPAQRRPLPVTEESKESKETMS